MPALLFNLHSSELIIIALVAILVFGRRLPEVVAQAAHGLGRLRAGLEKMRQDTGIDRELREVQRNVNQGLEHVRARDLQRAAQERFLSESGIDEATRRDIAEATDVEAVIHDPAADPSGDPTLDPSFDPSTDPGVDPFTPTGNPAAPNDGVILDPAAQPRAERPTAEPGNGSPVDSGAPAGETEPEATESDPEERP